MDTVLFRERLVRDATGRPVLRGYDAFERRQDTPMEVLPPALLARRDSLDAALHASDDLDSGVDSPATRALAASRFRRAGGRSPSRPASPAR